MRTPRSFMSRNVTYIIADISASLKASCSGESRDAEIFEDRGKRQIDGRVWWRIAILAFVVKFGHLDAWVGQLDFNEGKDVLV